MRCRRPGAERPNGKENDPIQAKERQRSACGVFGPAERVRARTYLGSVGPSSAVHRCVSRHAVMPPFKTKTRSNPESRRIRAAASERLPVRHTTTMSRLSSVESSPARCWSCPSGIFRAPGSCPSSPPSSEGSRTSSTSGARSERSLRSSSSGDK